MKQARWILTMAMTLALAAAAAAQAPPASAPQEPPRTTTIPRFENFKILFDRNIFDPNRRYDGPAPVVTVTSAPLAIERIALQGVFINEGEAVAIFEGTSPQYSTSVALGGIIAGHRIDAIHTDKVLLGFNDKRMDMPIAARLVLNNSTKIWEMTTDTTPMFASAAPSLPSMSSSSGSRDRGGDRSRDQGGDRSGDRSSSGRSRYSGNSGSSSRSSSRDNGPTPPPTAAPPAAGAPAGVAPAGGTPEEMLRQMMERRRKEMGQ